MFLSPSAVRVGRIDVVGHTVTTEKLPSMAKMHAALKAVGLDVDSATDEAIRDLYVRLRDAFERDRMTSEDS